VFSPSASEPAKSQLRLPTQCRSQPRAQAAVVVYWHATISKEKQRKGPQKRLETHSRKAFRHIAFAATCVSVASAQTGNALQLRFVLLSWRTGFAAAQMAFDSRSIS